MNHNGGVNTRRFFALLLIGLLIVPALGAAAPKKCAGKKATIVGTPKADVLDGTPGKDVIVGLGGGDEIYGSGGDDILCGGGGSDYINGGDGDDQLIGGGANDYMEGEGGDDAYKGGAGLFDGAAWQNPPGAITANLETGVATGDGTDSMIGIEALEGSPFNDHFTGSARNEDFYTYGGNDTIEAGGGHDYFESGAGDDVLDGQDGKFDFASFSTSPGPMTIDIGAGTATGDGSDTLRGAEIVSGTDFNDTLVGSEGRDILYPLGGDDTMDGRGDFDSLAYESARGPITANVAEGTATGEGNDTFTNMEAILGGPHDDVLIGSERTEDLVGHGGNDQLNGAGGEDYIEGNAGNDTIDGGVGPYDAIGHGDSLTPVTIDFAAGTVTGEGNDTITEIEIAIGSRHNDTLVGNDGDTLFYGLGGDDSIDGRAGFDIVLYESADRGMTVSLATGKASGEGNDTLAGIEGLLGSKFDDTLTGDSSDNVLVGFLGDDVLFGGDGADYFEPGPGDDVVDGQAGGQDVVDFYYAPGPVSVDLNTGVATGDGSDTLVAMEEVLGSIFDDTIFGSGVGNYLFGDQGNDMIYGREGDDGIDGAGGNDTVSGGAGTDECFRSESLTACEASQQPEGNKLETKGRGAGDYSKRNNM